VHYSVVLLHVSPLDSIVVAKTTVRSVQEQLCYQIINLHGYPPTIFSLSAQATRWCCTVAT
jgi:hypothetical protein